MFQVRDILQPKSSSFADYIKPLRPVLTTLGKRLPGISDIFDKNITLASIAEDPDIQSFISNLPRFKGKFDGAALSKWVTMAQVLCRKFFYIFFY